MTKSLEDYAKEIKRKECSCGAKLNIKPTNIQHYDHSNGYEVKDFEKKQWLYVHCGNCEYDWAIWKLGVPLP